MKPHWYKLYIYECPVCGRRRSLKVRMYGKKPTDINQHVMLIDNYDWCDV